jgi:hypothetical protein
MNRSFFFYLAYRCKCEEHMKLNPSLSHAHTLFVKDGITLLFLSLNSR